MVPLPMMSIGGARSDGNPASASSAARATGDHVAVLADTALRERVELGKLLADHDADHAARRRVGHRNSTMPATEPVHHLRGGCLLIMGQRAPTA
jgi:hypothetical protein